jgi:hypothetical protein
MKTLSLEVPLKWTKLIKKRKFCVRIGTEPGRTWLLEKNKDLVFLTYWTQTLIFLLVLDTNSFFFCIGHKLY